MIDSIHNQRKARCSLDLAVHVLEVMEGIIKSAEDKEIYNLKTTTSQPQFFEESEISKLKK